MKMTPQPNTEYLLGLPCYVQYEIDDRDPAYEEGGGFASLLFEPKTGRPLYAEPFKRHKIVLNEAGQRSIKTTFCYRLWNLKGKLVRVLDHSPDEGDVYVRDAAVRTVLNILKRGKFLARIKD